VYHYPCVVTASDRSEFFWQHTLSWDFVMASKRPEPPGHLSKAAQAWWRQLVADYEFESHHLRLLQLACESWDRCEQARERLAADGITFTDRFGQPRPHPSLAAERDSRIAFARLMRQLDLDASSAPMGGKR